MYKIHKLTSHNEIRLHLVLLDASLDENQDPKFLEDNKIHCIKYEHFMTIVKRSYGWLWNVMKHKSLYAIMKENFT